MDLYRIILVDDEEEVRKSIIRKIDWQAVGFTVVIQRQGGFGTCAILQRASVGK